MTVDQTLTNLTRVAYLNAMILALLSIQFILAPAFLLMFIIIPLALALLWFSVPRNEAATGFVVLSLLAFLLYGIDVFIWLLAYALVGLTLVGGHRLPGPLKILSTAVAITLTLLGMLAALLWIARVSWQEVGSVLASLRLFGDLAPAVILVTGGAVLALLLALLLQNYFSRLQSQLPILELSTVGFAHSSTNSRDVPFP